MSLGDTAAVDLVPMSPSADDVFVNLDAFDILADLSDDLDQQHPNEKNTIVDINPEWAYSEVFISHSPSAFLSLSSMSI